MDFIHIYKISEGFAVLITAGYNYFVLLFEMVLMQHLFGIVSQPSVEVEIETNIGYHWFLVVALNESRPHFATIG